MVFLEGRIRIRDFFGSGSAFTPPSDQNPDRIRVKPIWTYKPAFDPNSIRLKYSLSNFDTMKLFSFNKEFNAMLFYFFCQYVNIKDNTVYCIIFGKY